MRRRSYYLLPDVPRARAMLDNLLLARIEERHIHFIAQPNVLPPDMPEASLFQRTDLIHGTEVGVFIGAFAGLVTCALMLMMPMASLDTQIAAFVICGLSGALLGAWMAARASTAVPNSHLEQFREAINNGQVLLMVDVPAGRSGEIRAIVTGVGRKVAIAPDEAIQGLA